MRSEFSTFSQNGFPNDPSNLFFKDISQNLSSVLTISDIFPVELTNLLLSNHSDIIRQFFLIELQSRIKEKNRSIGVGQISENICNVSPMPDDKRECINAGIVTDLCNAPVHNRGHLSRLDLLIFEAVALRDNGNRPSPQSELVHKLRLLLDLKADSANPRSIGHRENVLVQGLVYRADLVESPVVSFLD